MRSLKELLPGKGTKPSSISVLLVDDEEPIRMVARAQLEDYGFEKITEAANGEEALNLAHLHHPDIIVLDYMMPIMDGETVARHLRSLSPNTVILVFSGVLTLNPPWADDFMDKLEIVTLPERVLALVELQRSITKFKPPRRTRGATPAEAL